MMSLKGKRQTTAMVVYKEIIASVEGDLGQNMLKVTPYLWGIPNYVLYNPSCSIELHIKAQLKLVQQAGNAADA